MHLIMKSIDPQVKNKRGLGPHVSVDMKMVGLLSQLSLLKEKWVTEWW